MSLVKNHGFVDGNKSVGISAMLILLSLNGLDLKYIQNELIDLGLGLASGKLNEDNVFRWIKERI